MLCKKGIVRSVLSVILSLVFVVGLIVCKSIVALQKEEKSSETFVGVVSENGFQSYEETAMAFVNCELNGEAAEPVYKDYKICSSLSANELEKLQLEKLTDERFCEGEEVQIEYVLDGKLTSAKSYFLQSERRTNERYHYFVLPAENGAPLTNSYLNSVMDGKHYRNCTSTMTLGMRVIGETITMDTTYLQTISLADDKVQFYQELPGTIQEVYLAEENNSIAAYLKHPLKNDDKFYSLSQIKSDVFSEGYIYDLRLIRGGEQVSIDDMDSMQDIADFIFLINLDASFFVKTNFGFRMTNKSYQKICEIMAGKEFAEEIEQAWKEFHINFRADYYVSEGRLSKTDVNLTMIHDEEIFALSVVTRYSDFGTTEVVLPTV